MKKYSRINIIETKSLDGQNFLHYQLIAEISIQDSSIQAEKVIAVNKSNTIILIGFSKYINIYKWQYEEVHQMSQIKDHPEEVTVLHFLKLSNSFISGSYDKSIRLWRIFNDKVICEQVIVNAHSWGIRQIVVNLKENLMISSSCNYTIKIWDKKQKEWKLGETIITKFQISNISLNRQEDLLVASGSFILQIWQFLGKKNKWIKKQVLQIPKVGIAVEFKTCFTEDSNIIYCTSKDLLLAFIIIAASSLFQESQLEFQRNKQLPQGTAVKILKGQIFILHRAKDDIILISLMTLKNQQLESLKQLFIEKKSKNIDYLLYGLDDTMDCILTEDNQLMFSWRYSQNIIQIRRFCEHQNFFDHSLGQKSIFIK